MIFVTAVTKCDEQLSGGTIRKLKDNQNAIMKSRDNRTAINRTRNNRNATGTTGTYLWHS